MGVHESDEVLVSRYLVARNGDALTDLYYKHHRMPYAIASRFFRSPDAVDNAVSRAGP